MKNDELNKYPGTLKQIVNTGKPMTIEEATKAIYDATNNMRWTSVKDKLPPADTTETPIGMMYEGKKYLILPYREVVRFGPFDEYGDTKGPDFYDWSDYHDTDVAYPDVTHWMEFPESPKL